MRMLLQFPESRVANHLRIGKELLPAYVTAFELLPLCDVCAKPRNCAYKHICK